MPGHPLVGARLLWCHCHHGNRLSSASPCDTRQRDPPSPAIRMIFLLSRLIRDGGLNPVIRRGYSWCLDGAGARQNDPQMLLFLDILIYKFDAREHNFIKTVIP